MPYIKYADKVRVNTEGPSNCGELNYAITCLIKEYWDVHGSDYQAINDIMGALSGAQAEFYRRVAVPYENQKIHDNGDCY